MLNKVQLIGHLGRDPELRQAGSKAVCSFTVATNERKDQTEWHSCVAWEKTAELICQYLRKGSKVYLEGSLRSREFESQGVKKYKTEIVVREVKFLDSREQSAGGGAARRPAAAPQDDKDIPF